MSFKQPNSKFQNNRISSFYYNLGTTFFWNDSSPKLAQYFFLWIAKLQSISIILWLQFRFLTTEDCDPLCYAFYNMSKILSTGEILISTTIDVSILIILGIISYFMLLFVFFVKMTIKVWSGCLISRNQRFFIFMLSQIHMTFIFWMMNTFLINFISSYQADSEGSVFSGVNNHILYVLCLLVLSLNYLITLVIAVFSHDHLKTSNILSSHTPAFQVITYCFKGLLLAIISLDVNYSIWYCVVLSLIILIGKQYHVLSAFPYYHYLPMKHCILLTSASLIIAILNFFILALRDVLPLSGTTVAYVEILLLIFVLKYVSIYFHKVIYQSLSKEDHLLQEREIIKKFFALTHIVEKVKFTFGSGSKKDLNELLLWSVWSSFLNGDEAATSQNLFKTSDQNTKGIYAESKVFIEFLENKIDHFLLKSLERVRYSNKLKIILADRMFNQNIISPLAIFFTLEVTKSQGLPKIVATMLIQQVEPKLQIFLENQSDGMLDIKGFVDFEVLSNKFVSMIHGNTREFGNFWKSYLKNDKKVIDLLVKSKKIEKNDDKIRSYWAKYTQTSHLFGRSLHKLYTIYLSLVRNAPFTAYKIDRKYNTLEDNRMTNSEERSLITQGIMTNPYNVIVHVTLTKEKLCLISDVSPNINDRVGWRREALIGRDIGVLFPRFKDSTNSILKIDSDNMSFTSILSSSIDTFIATKNGSVVLCNLFVSIYPYVQKELVYIAIARLKNKENDDLTIRLSNTSQRKILEDIDEFSASPKPLLSNNIHLNSERTDSKNIFITHFTSRDALKEPQINRENFDLRRSNRFHSGANMFSQMSHMISAKRNKDINVMHSVADSRTSYMTSKVNSMENLENGLYITPNNKKFSSLFYFSLLILCVSSVLLIESDFQNRKVLSLLEGDMDVLNNSTLRLIKVLHLNFATYGFSILEDGVFNDTRYSMFGVPSAKLIFEALIRLAIPKLSYHNIAIWNSLYRVDANLQPKVNSPIPMITTDALENINTESNSYNLVLKMVAAADRVVSKPFFQLTATDPDIIFIYNNTMNGLLRAGQADIEVIIYDTQQKQAENLNLILYFLLIVGILSLICIVLVLNILRLITKDRDKIIDILLRFDGKDISNHLMLVDKFCGVLDNTDSRKFNQKLKSEDFIGKALEMSKFQVRKRKSGDLTGVNSQILKLFFLGIFLILIILSGYLATLILVSERNTIVSRNIDLLYKSNSNLYEFSALFVEIFHYVATNTTGKFRGKPIDLEFQNTLSKLSLIQSELASITDSQKGIGDNPKLQEIIEGNICRSVSTFLFTPEECEENLYGIMKKGLLQTSSFIMASIQNVKLGFDASKRTHQDMFNALNQWDLVQSERIVLIYLFAAYEMVGTLIKEQLEIADQQFKTNVTIVVIVFISIYVIFGGFLTILTKRKIEDERIGWRKMLRLVPCSVIKTDKLLQVYISLSNQEINVKRVE